MQNYDITSHRKASHECLEGLQEVFRCPIENANKQKTEVTHMKMLLKTS